MRLANYNQFQFSPKHCNAPDASGFFSCMAGRGASALPVSAPLYYDEWVDFDCRRGHQSRPTPANPNPADSAKYCAGEPGPARALAQLAAVSATDGGGKERGCGDSSLMNLTGFNIALLYVTHFRQLALANQV